MTNPTPTDSHDTTNLPTNPPPTPPGTTTTEPGPSHATHLPVNETFGPVIQGEGPYAGRQASFIRLGQCNLHCPPCDTKQTWDTEQYDVDAECPPTFVDKIVRQVGRWNTPLVIISGGEPLIHQQRVAWERMLRGLIKLGMTQIHVETNGTITPGDTSRFLVSHFSVSPKLDAMGGADPTKRRIKPDTLLAFAELANQGHACLKIVCSCESDVEQAAAFADEHGFRREHLWIMPEGDTHEKASLTASTIGPPAVRMGANFTPRLHLMLGVR